MPPAAANAGAVQPIVVTVSPQPPANKPVVLPANHPLVISTAFLDYADAPPVGGRPQKQLSNSQMLRAFGRRCKLSQAPGFAPVPPGVLQLALSTQGWTKVLQELVTSGILSTSFDTLHGLDAAIDGLTIVNPGNLVLTSADLDLGEDTTAIAAVPGQAAIPGRGRRGRAGYVAPQPAIAAVPGRAALDAALEYLSTNHISVSSLEVAGPSPWANVVYLVGALGACLTQTARNGMGNARLTASTLAMGMSRAFGIAPADNMSLAGELPAFLTILRSRLPAPLRCVNADPTGLRVEFRDSILYGQLRDDRIRVETSRVHLIGSRHLTAA